MRSAFIAAWLLGVLLVEASPASAYRTAADLPEFEGAGRIAWAGREIPYELHPDVPVGVTLEAFRGAFTRAADTWGRVPCGDVRLVLQPPSGPAASGDGLNTIQFVREWTAMGLEPDVAATTELRYAELASGRVVIIEADILFNAEHFVWGTDPRASGVRDLEAVALHELGHLFGLLHPCGDPGAPPCEPHHAMASLHPFYLGPVRELGPDDREGYCSLYDVGPCGDCPHGYVCTGEGCRIACGETHCPIGRVCADERCVAPCELDDCGCERRCAPALGDPCESTAACGRGVCHEGRCRDRCGVDRECGGGWACDDGHCAAADGLGYLGDECTHGRECVSRLCLLVDGRGECSRPCEEGCPSGYLCVDVEDQRVCQRVSEGGCTTGGAAHRFPLGAGLLMAFAIRRRRSRIEGVNE